MEKKQWVLGVILVLTVNICFATNQKLSFQGIVDRYTNLKLLATPPVKGEKSAMFSSYDRKSKYDAQNQKYENWSANFDGDGYESKEGDVFILATINGPGVVNRIWSALPQEGEMIFEIDGKDVLTIPAQHVFDGKHLPFNFSEFVYTSAKGRNNYIPICFQKKCRIKVKEKWGKFYQINYTVFPKGTSVPSFKGFFSKEEQEVLQQAQNTFLNAAKSNADKLEAKKIELKSGEKRVIFSVEGNKAINRFEIDLKGNDFLGNLIQNLHLEVYWDHEATPAVSCPLGAFFAATIHDCKKLREFTAVPLGIEGTKLYSNWYMPFKQNAKIVVTNTSSRTVKLEHKVAVEKYNKSEDKGYFHVQWNDGLKPIEQERWPDRELLSLNGKGRFCGMMLTVLNPVSGIEYGYNLPKYNAQWWWGEGDEKFYIDGEKFPSTYGTGTEDYFGYAWGWPVEFSAPFHSQTYTTAEGLDENNAPHFVKNGNRVVSMNRFQIMDNVPFQKSFYATLEQYYPDERPIKFQTALYFYINRP